MMEWAEATEAEIEKWQDLSPEDKNERALELFDRPGIKTGE